MTNPTETQLVLFSKQDLLFKSYFWIHNDYDEQELTNLPDSKYFNRSEGNEVLHLIRRTMQKIGLESVEDGQRLEMLIHQKLPKNLRTRAACILWIMTHY